jgi:hypothetical protein
MTRRTGTAAINILRKAIASGVKRRTAIRVITKPKAHRIIVISA